MTRGQIVVFHSKGITTSTEFNGDMYFPDGEWAGHGQQVVDALKDIKTVDDYKQFVRLLITSQKKLQTFRLCSTRYDIYSASIPKP